MKANIYMVTGSKGGVGKSIVSAALVDYMAEIRGEKVFLVESDTSNPDVGRTYLKVVDGVQRMPGAAFDLDEAEGWVNLINAAEQYPDHHLIVNNAARNGKGIAAYSELFAGSSRSLERKIITIWVINQERDGLELCKKYMETAPFGTLHIVRNGFFGDMESFELYENSKLKKVVEEQGKSLYFHKLYNVVCDTIRNGSIPVADALDDKELFRVGSRTALAIWRDKYKLMFDEIIS